MNLQDYAASGAPLQLNRRGTLVDATHGVSLLTEPLRKRGSVDQLVGKGSLATAGQDQDLVQPLDPQKEGAFTKLGCVTLGASVVAGEAGVTCCCVCCCSCGGLP